MVGGKQYLKASKDETQKKYYQLHFLPKHQSTRLNTVPGSSTPTIPTSLPLQRACTQRMLGHCKSSNQRRSEVTHQREFPAEGSLPRGIVSKGRNRQLAIMDGMHSDLHIQARTPSLCEPAYSTRLALRSPFQAVAGTRSPTDTLV